MNSLVMLMCRRCAFDVEGFASEHLQDGGSVVVRVCREMSLIIFWKQKEGCIFVSIGAAHPYRAAACVSSRTYRIPWPIQRRFER